MNIKIETSTAKGKKYMASVPVGDRIKKVHFGSKGDEDYLMHGDEVRKDRYINRNKRLSKFWEHTHQNLLRPSYWSRWYSWNHETTDASARFIESQFDDVIIT